MKPEITTGVLMEVMSERARQDEKWGVQEHDLPVYLTILTEEVGETAQAILEHRFGVGQLYQIRSEAIQVAAVAVAMVERMDRMKEGA